MMLIVTFRGGVIVGLEGLDGVKYNQMPANLLPPGNSTDICINCPSADQFEAISSALAKQMDYQAEELRRELAASPACHASLGT